MTPFLFVLLFVVISISLFQNLSFSKEIKGLKQNLNSLINPVKVKLFLNENALVPTKGSREAGAYDIHVNLKLLLENLANKDWALKYAFKVSNIKGKVLLLPGGRLLIPTGLHFELPVGYKMNIRPRSGLAAKFGIMLTNAPGLLDSDYRDDCGVIITNTGDKPFDIEEDMRIAQIEIVKEIGIDWILVSSKEGLNHDNDRGGGFGSTDTEKVTNVEFEPIPQEAAPINYTTTTTISKTFESTVPIKTKTVLMVTLNFNIPNKISNLLSKIGIRCHGFS